MVLMSMTWVGFSDWKCLFHLSLPGVWTWECVEQPASVETVVLGDFGVAIYAMYVARGSRLLE